jgi:hypothetical protein
MFTGISMNFWVKKLYPRGVWLSIINMGFWGTQWLRKKEVSKEMVPRLGSPLVIGSNPITAISFLGLFDIYLPYPASILYIGLLNPPYL